MPIWVYFLDLFRLVSGYDSYGIGVLVNMAVNEAEEQGIKPSTICHLEVGGGVIIEVRGSGGLALKLIKAKDPVKALKEFYENEDKVICINA